MYILDWIMDLTPEDITAYSTLTLSLVTFIAVLVALFQEQIRDVHNKTKIKAAIHLKPPHSHLIALTNSVNGEFISNSIYIRILVSNVKNKTANNVEVMASNFWYFDANNKKHIKSSFLPMNLQWAHYHTREMKIPGKLFRHCDLGPIRPLINGFTVLKLDTMVSPNPVEGFESPNIIRAGKYQFELIISGENTNIIKKRWNLEFDDVWDDNESAMLENHIKITEVKPFLKRLWNKINSIKINL